ncbi:MAG: hypothetical protein ACKO01_03770 [Erythrobacter sp.]
MNPVGLFDLDRKIRKVGEEFRTLIADWREVLPLQSVCLTVPVVPLDEVGGHHARRQEREARRTLGSPPTSPGEPAA